MKSILKDIFRLSVLLFSVTISFAQNNHIKLPENTVFYMEINGNELNKKVNWEKFNPFLQEITKKNNKKSNWNDFSKSGLKYNATQYHYATFNDSIKSYTAHFEVDNKEKFLNFINSSKKEGLEISKKNKYSYVDLGDNMFVAWNDKRAVLSYISYSKPYKNIWSKEVAEDSLAMSTVDSAAVAAKSAVADVVLPPKVAEQDEIEENAEAEPFNYKEEIKYLKDDIKYLKESIKENQAEILRIQKDIKYLEKHHKYPEEKPVLEKKPSEKEHYDEMAPPPIISKSETEDTDEEQDTEEVSTESDNEYLKEQDSINIEEFKMVKNLAEIAFNQYFDSDFQIEASKEMLKYKDAKADVYISTEFGNIFLENRYNQFYGGLNSFSNVLNKMYNSRTTYNLYFEDDKVRLVNNYQHQNPETQKSISNVYKGKRNKKLASLISDNNIGYYAINVDGSKYFDLFYEFFKEDGDAIYQKEMEMMVETMKIVLDEKEIAKIAPGNGIFVLNQLKSQKVDYTDYEYDDNYNSKEVKKTKEVSVPDFTFAFATENENYWHKLFEMLANNLEISKHFSKTGNIYMLKNEKSSVVNKMFFTIKDGIVYCSTSVENMFTKNQSDATKKLAKESYKHSQVGKFNVQKLLIGLEAEVQSNQDKKIYNFLKKNVGSFEFKTDAKKESIETELQYNIKNSADYENSLMYFFYIFDEINKYDNPIKKVETAL